MIKQVQKFPRGVEVAVSPIIENKEWKILLVKSPKWSNKWIFPGGHIEPGETIAEALIRETTEEVGLKIKIVKTITFGELIGSKDFHRPAHFIYIDVYCTTDDDQVKLDGVELTEYIWIDAKQALEMDLADSYAETIMEFLKYKKSTQI
jgi:8-oxo-dGTP pyrophosphatase MutT (NUDIX family)